MAKAKKLPSGTYRIQIYLGLDANGKKRYKSITDPDKKRCERLASEYLDEHREFMERESFGSCLEQYITRRKAVLSPSTIRGYKSVQRTLTSEYKAFCEVSVYDLNRNILQDLVNAMTERYTPKTIRNVIGLTTAVLKFKGVNPPIVTLPEKKKPNLHIPDEDEVKLLLKEAEGTDMEVPILLAAFAPMRRGEICALKMEDIKGNTIHVRRSVVLNSDNELIEKAPKTYSSDRYIVMPEYIIKKIRDKGYITKYEKPNALTSAFERLASKCGLSGVRFHDLRHFCASWLHAQNVPEEYILERGGWSTANVMKAVYRHALASEEDRISKGIVDKVNETFGDVM